MMRAIAQLDPSPPSTTPNSLSLSLTTTIISPTLHNIGRIPLGIHNILLPPSIHNTKLSRRQLHIQSIQRFHFLPRQDKVRHTTIGILSNSLSFNLVFTSRPRHTEISLLQGPPDQRLCLGLAMPFPNTRQDGPPLGRAIRRTQARPRVAGDGTPVRLCPRHNVAVLLKGTQD